MIGEVLQAFEQRRHVEVGQIRKIQFGFIASELFFEDRFQVPVEG